MVHLFYLYTAVYFSMLSLPLTEYFPIIQFFCRLLHLHLSMFIQHTQGCSYPVQLASRPWNAEVHIFPIQQGKTPFQNQSARNVALFLFFDWTSWNPLWSCQGCIFSYGNSASPHTLAPLVMSPRINRKQQISLFVTFKENSTICTRKRSTKSMHICQLTFRKHPVEPTEYSVIINRLDKTVER